VGGVLQQDALEREERLVPMACSQERVAFVQ
jgi:hypothetical protein